MTASLEQKKMTRNKLTQLGIVTNWHNGMGLDKQPEQRSIICARLDAIRIQEYLQYNFSISTNETLI